MPENKHQKIIVSGILESPEGVFVAKRSSKKIIAPGIYHLPGGHVEFGENPEDALIREFKEEFNLNIKIERLIKTFSYHNSDSHTVGIIFSVNAVFIPDPIFFDRSETDEIAWVKEKDLREYFLESDHDYMNLRYYFSL